MPRTELSPDDVAAFRRRCVDAARRLFSEGGESAVTMRSVAEVLGCSPMTSYRYFANREALLASLRAWAFRRFADAQRDAAGEAADGLARVQRLREAYVAFALSEPEAYRLMFSLRASAVRDEELEAESRRAFSYLQAAVAAAVASGELLGDPSTLAHLVWAEVHGIVSLHVAGKLIFGRSAEELVAAPIVMRAP